MMMHTHSGAPYDIDDDDMIHADILTVCEIISDHMPRCRRGIGTSSAIFELALSVTRLGTAHQCRTADIVDVVAAAEIFDFQLTHGLGVVA